MISPKDMFDSLKRRGVGLYAGVPDSLLSSLSAYIEDNESKDLHVIAANEGNAVGLAVGHHLATGKVGVVYLQNSGLGNIINPLTSLADYDVYKIPMIFIIGWRGEPGFKDEPQHVKQGRVMLEMLDALEMPYSVMSADSVLEDVLEETFDAVKNTNAPVAIVVKKGTFSSYKPGGNAQRPESMKREVALSKILDVSSSEDLFISTTGKTSRELFELRKARNETPKDFLTVGGMGHTASIAAGVALGQPNKKIVCVDGDGSLLMHMGAVPIIGSLGLKNFTHILLNNGAHESVGGQPTIADNVDFKKISQACGYSGYFVASSEKEIEEIWPLVSAGMGCVLFEVKIAAGSRPDLGRPTKTPEENKIAFMEHASANE